MAGEQWWQRRRNAALALGDVTLPVPASGEFPKISGTLVGVPNN